MPETLTLIMVLVSFVGFSLSFSNEPKLWKVLGFLGMFVLGGFII